MIYPSKKGIIVSILVVLLALIIFFLTQKKHKISDKFKDDEKSIEQKDLNFIEKQGAGFNWKIKADFTEESDKNDEKHRYLSNFKLDIVFKDDSKMTLESDNAVYLNVHKAIQFKEKLKITYNDYLVINAQNVLFYVFARLINSQEKFNLKVGENELNGGGFEIKFDNMMLEIYNFLKLKFSNILDEDILIESNRGNYKLDKNYFNVINLKKFKLKHLGQVLSAQKGYFNFNDKNKVNKIIISSKVVIKTSKKKRKFNSCHINYEAKLKKGDKKFINCK